MTIPESRSQETLTDWARRQAQVITYPVARRLTRWGIHPNTITILGCLLTMAVGAVLATGRLRLGGLLLLAASSLDAFDGALARVSGEKSRFGAFLDSTLDRFSEGALFFGLLVTMVRQGEPGMAYLVFAAAIGSLMVSYVRARAEGVGYEGCKVGLLTRVERVILLGSGLALGLTAATLWVLAVGVWLTVAQRMAWVYRESRR